MLARLPKRDARAVLRRSDLRAYTPGTTWRMEDLEAKLERTARLGYALAVEEIFPSDVSLGAAIIGPRNETLGAVSLSVSRLRVSPEDAEQRLAPLLTVAAHALSSPVLPPG